MIADETQRILNAEVLGSAKGLSRRTADRVAGLPMAQAALKFASARHAHQYREIDHAPFIAHPIEVGWLLRCDGQADELIPPACSMTCWTRPRPPAPSSNAGSGPAFARLVETVSDDPSIGDYEERKRELRDRVARADSETFAIFAGTRSPRSESWRRCHDRDYTKPRPERSLRITARASRRSAESQRTRSSSTVSTPSSHDSSRRRSRDHSAGADTSVLGSKRSKHRTRTNPDGAESLKRTRLPPA